MKIGIVIVNWNGISDTRECLESLAQCVDDRSSVIVVDNGSDSNNLETLDGIVSHLKIIKLQKNRGFAGGSNAGISYALDHGAEYILLLNNDTTVEPGFIDELLSVLDGDEQIGAVAPYMYYYQKPDVLWWAGGFLNLRIGRITNLGVRKKKPDMSANNTCVDYITGCCILIRSNVIREVGLLSEDYFHTGEDVDYSLRIRAKGYQLQVVTRSQIWHKVASSGGGEYSPFYMYYLERNRLLVMKNFDYWNWYSPILLIPLWTKRLIAGLIKGEGTRSSLSVIWAIKDYLSGVRGESRRF